MSSSLAQKQPNKFQNWTPFLNATILSAFFYVFMEWVFFVTKPSSVSNISIFEALKTLVLTGGAVALIPLAALLCLLPFSYLIGNQVWRERLTKACYLFPAGVLAVTALMMFDNFTYTIYYFGVISTEGWLRVVYIIGFFFIFYRGFRWLSQNKWIQTRSASILSLTLIGLSLLGCAGNLLSDKPGLHNPYTERSKTAEKEYPNIIILGSDGLSAEYLSAYGYSLNTTPFLSELIKTSLAAENAFPNASSTTASTTSILTGKEPATSGVFRFPDILSGLNSFEHLPGILRRHGYQTVEIGTPYYVDARKLNLWDGFEVEFNQSLDISAVDALLEPILGNSQSMYFTDTILERAIERLLHIFFIRKMENPVTVVHDPDARISDEERVEDILNTLDQADRPVFIFTHMMNTHGPEFAFDEQVFSTGPGSKKWDKSRYLDAILSFDGNVKKIYEHLLQNGQLDHTILVVYTDHGYLYTINERIPILIHFPADAHAGTIQNNAQVIDLPVTILDYLGFPKPEWMTGTSLLDGEPPADRIIFSTTTGSPSMIKPPFYQINTIQGIICDRWYSLDVRKKKYTSGRIKSHTSPCTDANRPDRDLIRLTLLEYLEDHGYDTLSLR